jgi:DNA-binding transcriptional ArsR family regulator
MMNPDLSKVASLISDSTRSTILLCLMDGGAHPASELAHFSKVTPQTASFHLSKLLDAHLIRVEKYGRHRYFKLSNSQVAQSIEHLLALAPEPPVRSLKDSREKKVIHYARTCYDHLAGYIGVQVTNSLLREGFIKKNNLDFEVTPKGTLFFHDFGINLEEQEKKRRAYARCCLDWSERHDHLAGALGNALLEKLFELKWIQRLPNTRAIKVTPEGEIGLKETFMIELNP